MLFVSKKGWRHGWYMGGAGVLGSRGEGGELVKVVSTGSSPILYVFFMYLFTLAMLLTFYLLGGCGYDGVWWLFEGRWVGWFYLNSCFYYCSSLFFFTSCAVCWSIVLVRFFFFIFGMEEFFYLSEADFLLVNSIFFFPYCFMRSL